jgi:hypothetical protein
MTSSGMFNSDLAGTFQEAWDTFHRALHLKPDDWSKTDWQRLVDLYRLSRIADVKKFDALSNELQSLRCVPDTRTLIEIGEWKARKRITGRLQGNKDSDVRDTSKTAFEMIERFTPTQGGLKASIQAIKCLREGFDGQRKRKPIQGMGIPMASVLLAMYSPKDFPVIDRLAYSLLCPKESVQGVEISGYKQWTTYLERVQGLANRHGLGCRDIDSALWSVALATAEARRYGVLSDA